MATTFLAELGLAPSRIAILTSQQRNQLLSFLERWGYLADLHTCLDHILETQPNLVSMLDLRARAYKEEERYDDAVTVVQHRIALRTSLTAQTLYAELAIAQGDLDTAEELIAAMRTESPDSVMVWRLTGDVALARGDTVAAMAAYPRVGELTSQGRSYLLGMMALYQARNDWVTASGYAVRVVNSAEAPEELPATTLRTLLTYFEASEEETRARRMREALETRYTLELDELKAALGTHLHKDADPVTVTHQAGAGSREVEHPDLPLQPVPVSDQERQVVINAVRDTFGFEKLLPGQLETISAVQRGDNVLSILPTGGGKSLCYQVPAMIAESGTTLVISPLIALMKDQIDSLPPSLRERAATLNSSLDGDALREHLARTTAGQFRLVYAAPERLRQPTFLHALRSAGVNRLVVDEAHCVSVWGHDFRPDYLKITEAWDSLGRPPILALTATAPPRVRRDIIQHLSPELPMATVTGDLVRPNLQLEAIHATNLDGKLQRLVAFCRATPGSGIVYADTRARCEELATLLRSQGVDAAHYHAGIENRSAVQDAFMTGKTRVIVATIAFGMGIDKPDIRFIVHFLPPASLESYYQEAGRAGRDGQPARCLLMVTRSDHALLTGRMRRDLPTVEFLRQVYAAATRYLRGGRTEEFQAIASIAPGDLERDLQIDDTRIRVALSILEENGLLMRGPDTPRAALIRLRNTPTPSQSLGAAGFRAFQNATHLTPDQWLQCNLIESALQAELSPITLEQKLLEWSSAGYIDCRFSGRNMLLAKIEPPKDVADRINLWLDRFTTIQIQRIDEIMAYAHTDHCRHGHLSAYLGGRRVQSCTSCDNCVVLKQAADSVARSGAALPEEREQFRLILGYLAAAPHGWGLFTLTRILRGDKDAPDKARQQTGFGCLSFRSQSAVRDLITLLVNHDFLALRPLENGGEVVELTKQGYAALQQPQKLDRLIRAQVSTTPASGQAPDLSQADEALFQRLRAWRLEEAKTRSVAPYVIFHDSHLRAMAMSKPRTREELLALKGVGARKVATYGETMLALIRDHAAGRSAPPARSSSIHQEQVE
jgi:ATP-dependent DNA helicase RecQ